MNLRCLGWLLNGVGVQGTTDARKCSPAVPEAFGNDQNKDQKQMELGNRCEKSNAGNSVPLTSQSSVSVEILLCYITVAF